MCDSWFSIPHPLRDFLFYHRLMPWRRFWKRVDEKVEYLMFLKRRFSFFFWGLKEKKCKRADVMDIHERGMRLSVPRWLKRKAACEGWREVKVKKSEEEKVPRENYVKDVPKVEWMLMDFSFFLARFLLSLLVQPYLPLYLGWDNQQWACQGETRSGSLEDEHQISC